MLVADALFDVDQVWACLLWNVISVLLGVAGAAYLCRLLADRSFSERFCDAETWGGIVPTEKERTTCMNDMWILNVSPSLGPIWASGPSRSLHLSSGRQVAAVLKSRQTF